MDHARQWMLRVNEPDFGGWDEFSQWLGASRDHLAAYEAALDQDAWAAGVLGDAAQPELYFAAASIEAPSPAWRPRSGGGLGFIRPHHVWGGAVAASLAAIFAFSPLMHGPDLVEIITAPGEHRSIALGDGSRVEVNGNSQILYNPDDPRRITLASGEALFDVRHNAAHPFVVKVGDTNLVDAGTVFNVVSDKGGLDVAVAEGEVIYEDRRREVRLQPGDRLVQEASGGGVRVERTEPANIGTWREGLLHYQDASLDVIARDLSRAVGKPVRVAPGARYLRYSGALVIAGSEQDLLTSVSALLGVAITETADSWEISAPAS